MVVVESLLVIAGALLAAAVVRRGSMTTDLALLLTVGIIFGYPFFHADVGPLPISLPRLIIGLMAVRWGISFLQGRGLPLRLGVTELSLLGFVVYLAIQLSMTNWQYNEQKPLSRYLFFIVLPSLVYPLVAFSDIPTIALTRFRLAIAAFGGYLALTAIGETLGPASLVFPSYILSPEQGEYLGRARGPFLNPTPNGIAMTMALLCGASFWPNATRPIRMVIIAFVLLMLGGTFLTYTRSCWAGAVMGLGVLVLFNLPPRVRFALVMVAGVFSLPLLLEIKDRASSFKRDKHVTAEEMAKSASLRPLLAQVALEIFQDRPWTGVGYGQYLEHNHHYIDSSVSDEPLQSVKPYVQHNTILALLAETGLIGTMLFGIFTIGSLGLGMRLAMRTDLNWDQRSIAWILLATLVAWGFNAMWHDLLIDGNGLPMWTGLVGLTAAVYRRNEVAISVDEGLSSTPVKASETRETIATLAPLPGRRMSLEA